MNEEYDAYEGGDDYCDVLETAVLQLFIHGPDVCEDWQCPSCGRHYVKISCASAGASADLVIRGNSDDTEWEVIGTLEAEEAMVCDCLGDDESR